MNRGQTPISLISRAYDAVLYGMAWLAALLIAAMMVVITVDVVVRNLGYQSSAHFFTFTEYALLLIPCLGEPWLVREKGHVCVEILLMYLSRDGRKAATFLIGVACVGICLVMAWYGFEVTANNFRLGDMDVRSFDAPRWALVVCIPVSFLMMAIEFARFLARGENFLGFLGVAVHDAEKER
jgi:TRAP-type C4-dicarboxylate transport system permease small subunit